MNGILDMVYLLAMNPPSFIDYLREGHLPPYLDTGHRIDRPGIAIIVIKLY